MGNGVKVVGATYALRPGDQEHDGAGEFEGDTDSPSSANTGRRQRVARGPAGTADDRPPVTGRHRFATFVLALVALAGVAGTITFERAWSGINRQNVTGGQARQAASSFLVALTNFDAKSVDNDFAHLTAMATGPFAKQANQFFNSSIRQQLQTALASSRGQIRNIYVQSVSGDGATVYAVVDQLYVNRTLSAPQSDVLRVVVQMTDAGGTWKVSDVTVLEGPSINSPSPSSTSSSTPGS